MRHVGRDKNEITGIRFGSKLQPVTPAHSRLAARDIDDAFEVAVVMSAGFRIGLDRDRACPQFFGAGRAKLMAALRSMPAVEGTFGSSWSPGMTRTPSCFQRSAEGSCVIRPRFPGSLLSGVRPRRRVRLPQSRIRSRPAWHGPQCGYRRPDSE